MQHVGRVALLVEQAKPLRRFRRQGSGGVGVAAAKGGDAAPEIDRCRGGGELAQLNLDGRRLHGVTGSAGGVEDELTVECGERPLGRSRGGGAAEVAQLDEPERSPVGDARRLEQRTGRRWVGAREQASLAERRRRSGWVHVDVAELGGRPVTEGVEQRRGEPGKEVGDARSIAARLGPAGAHADDGPTAERLWYARRIRSLEGPGQRRERGGTLAVQANQRARMVGVSSTGHSRAPAYRRACGNNRKRRPVAMPTPPPRNAHSASGSACSSAWPMWPAAST